MTDEVWWQSDLRVKRGWKHNLPSPSAWKATRKNCPRSRIEVTVTPTALTLTFNHRRAPWSWPTNTNTQSSKVSQFKRQSENKRTIRPTALTFAIMRSVITGNTVVSFQRPFARWTSQFPHTRPSSNTLSPGRNMARFFQAGYHSRHPNNANYTMYQYYQQQVHAAQTK